MMTSRIEEYLDYLFPEPKCELNYKTDYELLIAIMLSAQSTDKRVNSVTPVIFEKYSTLKALKEAKLEDLERTPLFIKLQEVPQSDILQSIYLDSLISIQSQLNHAIKQEKKYIKNGIETTWLKNQQKKKKSIDNTISLFNDGKTVTDISEHLKSSQR